MPVGEILRKRKKEAEEREKRRRIAIKEGQKKFVSSPTGGREVTPEEFEQAKKGKRLTSENKLVSAEDFKKEEIAIRRENLKENPENERFLGERPEERSVLESGTPIEQELAQQSTLKLVLEDIKDSFRKIDDKRKDSKKMALKRQEIFFGRVKETGKKSISIIPFGAGPAIADVLGLATAEDRVRNFEQKLEPYTQDPSNIVSNYQQGILSRQESLNELKKIEREIDDIEIAVKNELLKDFQLIVDGTAEPIQADLIDARKESFDAAQIIINEDSSSPAISNFLEQARLQNAS